MIGSARSAALPGVLAAWVAAFQAHARAEFKIEGARVGESILKLVPDDSIQAPDLSRMEVSGHQIAAAAFVEDREEFVPSPMLVDAAMDPDLRVVATMQPGVIELEAPPSFIPRVNMVLSDTAFGGILVKVAQIRSQSPGSGSSRRWMLETRPAAVTDAIYSCDIFYQTHLDLNLVFSDHAGLRRVPDGRWQQSGLSREAEIGFALRDARVLAHPRVAGRLRIQNGRVEVFTAEIEGNFEFAGDFQGSISGTGEFLLEEALPETLAVQIPLAKGLFVRIAHHAAFALEASSRGNLLAARAQLELDSKVEGSLDFRSGQWQPNAMSRLSPRTTILRELAGEGEMKFVLVAKVDVRLNGRHGPTYVFEPFLRLSARAIDSGAVAAHGSLGQSGNKYANLGMRFHMRLGANLDGSSDTRNFQVFSRELPHLAPPSRGLLSVAKADTAGAILLCRGQTGAEFYLVQMWDGQQWKTVQESQGPSLRVNGLAPGTQYRFRVAGVNAMGVGNPFPAEGILVETRAINRAPVLPEPLFPYPGASTRDPRITLFWKGGDPDGDSLSYDVHLDTLNPPERLVGKSLSDSTLSVGDLRPGKVYFWRVIADDGRAVSEGPVWSFAALGGQAGAAPGMPAVNPEMVLIPGGSFQRADGSRVEVNSFLLQKYEVTQGEYRRVTGQNPSYRLHDSLPVERVLWEEAAGYCAEIGGRLPTEAEWEYAARADAGPGGRSSGSPGEYAWYFDNSGQHTHPVGTRRPNAWGLHDMLGNVAEWVQDWYGEYTSADLDNPDGPETGTARVVRGASWYSEPESLDPALRLSNRPGFRSFKVGFRCARDQNTHTDPIQAREAAASSP